jgi:TRAP-type C4-dicarboxylate transport system permease small subunit
MKKYINGFNGLLLVVMFLITFWQIINRFLPGEATVWSEEVARFLFVWIVFLGAGTLVRDGEHIRISIVTDRLSPKAGRIVHVISAALVIPFVIFMTWGGYKNMIKQWNTFAPTVDWLRLGYVYLALVLGGSIMLLYLLRNLINEFFAPKPESDPSFGDSP